MDEPVPAQLLKELLPIVEKLRKYSGTDADPGPMLESELPGLRLVTQGLAHATAGLMLMAIECRKVER